MDFVIGGLAPKTLTVIAGRPSSGKTSLAMKWALETIQSKKRVGIFTSDHSPEDFSQRMIASTSNISTKQIRNGRITDSEWPKLIQAAASVSELEVDFFPDTWISVAAVREKAEAGKYDLLIIDKFHSLILKDEAQEGYNNRINELNQSAIEIKGIAKELNIAIVIICDINKGQEERVDRRPMLKDLKDLGGVLESYADVVIGLFLPAEYEQHELKSEAILLKNRFGQQITVSLEFNRKTQTFSDALACEIAKPQSPPT